MNVKDKLTSRTQTIIDTGGFIYVWQRCTEIHSCREVLGPYTLSSYRR